VSNQPRRIVPIQEVLRPTTNGGRRINEGEDQSSINNLLRRLQNAAPSAAKGGQGGKAQGGTEKK
jgi:hypothetical protein